MIDYLDALHNTLREYGIADNDIIIVGSGAITDMGFRKNNDIEFACNQKAYRKLPLRIRLWLLISDHYDIGEKVDVFRGRYINAGIHDETLFKSNLYRIKYGYCVVMPEIEYCYKKKRNWEKDISDFVILGRSEYQKQFDFQFINSLLQKKIGLFDRLYDRFRIGMGWRLAKLEAHLLSGPK